MSSKKSTYLKKNKKSTKKNINKTKKTKNTKKNKKGLSGGSNNNNNKTNNLIFEYMNEDYNDENKRKKLIDDITEHLNKLTKEKRKNLINDKIENVNFRDFKLNYLIMKVILKGDVEFLQYLIDNGANVNIVIGKALYFALKMENSNIVELLIDKGATYSDSLNNTLLHIAASNKITDIVELLIKKGADVNMQNKDGNTPLHIAALNKNVHYKALEKNKKIIDLLIENKADVNMQNKDGNTPLHTAVISKINYTVDLLLDKGANVNMINNDGYTPPALAEELVKQDREYNYVINTFKYRNIIK
jgi:ankyrin repeat protein